MSEPDVWVQPALHEGLTLKAGVTVNLWPGWDAKHLDLADLPEAGASAAPCPDPLCDPPGHPWVLFITETEPRALDCTRGLLP